MGLWQMFSFVLGLKIYMTDGFETGGIIGEFVCTASSGVYRFFFFVVKL